MFNNWSFFHFFPVVAYHQPTVLSHFSPQLMYEGVHYLIQILGAPVGLTYKVKSCKSQSFSSRLL